MMKFQIVDELFVDKSRQTVGLDSFKSISYKKKLDVNKENHYNIEILGKTKELIEESIENILIFPTPKEKSKHLSDHSNYIEVKFMKKEFNLNSFPVFQSKNNLKLEVSSSQAINPPPNQELSITSFPILNLSEPSKKSSSSQTHEPIRKEVFPFFNSSKSLTQLPQGELQIQPEPNPSIHLNNLQPQLSSSRFQIFSSKSKSTPTLHLESTYSSSINPDPESKSQSILSVLLTESCHNISICASSPVIQIDSSSSSDSESSDKEDFHLTLSQFSIKSHSSLLKTSNPDQIQCIKFNKNKGKICLNESKPCVFSIIPSSSKHFLDFSETNKILIIPAYTPLGNSIRVSTRLQLGRDPVKDFFILVRFT